MKLTDIASALVFAATVLAVACDGGGDEGPAGTATPIASARIAFTSSRDGNAEVYVMNADGTGQTNLTNSPGDDCCAAWSSDDSRIVFLAGVQDTHPGLGGQVYVMNADGAGQTNLTQGPMESCPAWSPEGSQIAFVSRRAGDTSWREIYVMSADGTGLTNLSNGPGEDYNESPAWSPDGSRIAFYSSRNRNGEIYVVNADGSGLTNLTNSPGGDGDVCWPGARGGHVWSPDGTKIAFSSSRDGSQEQGGNPLLANIEIYVMNADGTGQTRLTTSSPAQDIEPAWSPDGSQIAFTSQWTVAGGYSDIYVMNADGTGLTKLTGEGWDNSPTWSPDGSQIAFVSRRDGQADIYVMNADGSGQTNLTNNPAEDYSPAWRP